MEGKEENEKKDEENAKSISTDESYEREMDDLRRAHAAYLVKLWNIYGSSVFVGSVMHATHAAMSKYEIDFLRAMEKKKGVRMTRK